MIINILRILLIILGLCILNYTVLNDTDLMLGLGIISGIGCFYMALNIDIFFEDD